MYRVMTPDSEEMWLRTFEFLQRTGGVGQVTRKDVAHVAIDNKNNVVGVFAANMVALVHTFRTVDDNIAKRRVAEALWHYAMGAARSGGIEEGIIIVDKDNDAMLRFLGDAQVSGYGTEDTLAFLIKVR